MFPGIHSQVTVAIVKQAGQSVAHLVTHLVPCLSLAVKRLASLQALFKVKAHVVHTGAAVVEGIAPAVIQVDLAIAAPKSLDAGAAVVGGAVAVVTAGAACTLINVNQAVLPLVACTQIYIIEFYQQTIQ